MSAQGKTFIRTMKAKAAMERARDSYLRELVALYELVKDTAILAAPHIETQIEACDKAGRRYDRAAARLLAASNPQPATEAG
jgi:hypothetical protein